MKSIIALIGILGLLVTSVVAQERSKADQDIRYGGNKAELSVVRVSARTIELQLSQIGQDEEPTEPPPSAILVDYPRSQVWKGRSIGSPLEFNIGDLTVEIQPSPLSVIIRKADGAVVQELSWPDESGGTYFRTDASVFGLGEGGAQKKLDRRGFLHSMNDGNAAFKRATHGAYIATPMLIGADGWVMFVHHPISRMNLFDLRNGKGLFMPNQETQKHALKLFVTAWKEPMEVFSEYRIIAGETPMPPKWALGYMQSHRTLSGSGEIQWVAQNFRTRNLPADALIYLGTGFTPTGWNKGHGSFEFNPLVFDDPSSIISDLKDLNFNVVLHTYSPPRGLHGLSIDSPSLEDSTHISNYWDRHEPVLELGIDGWWPDGGENLSAESRVARHRMYWLGSLDNHPNVRPWSLHRTGYSGVHRYGGWIWSGDPDSRWETLKTHIEVGLNHSVSLSPYWGSDIAGFVPTDELTGELYIRWFQFSTFTPSFRGHGRAWHLRLPWGWNRGHIGPAESSIFDSEDLQKVRKDGYPYPEELRNALIEPIAREYLHLRYHLLPYNYTLARQTYDTGMPPMRAMWLHYPDDPKAISLGDQYMWGRDLLVAPVYIKGATQRSLYLPEGLWYDFWTNETQSGGDVTRQVDLATLPLYVRAGAIIPFDPVRQYTDEEVNEPTTIKVYTGADGQYTMYEDDGISLDYLEGKATWTRMTWDDSGKKLVIEPGAPEGSTSQFTNRKFKVQLLPEDTTKNVNYSGQLTEVVF